MYNVLYLSYSVLYNLLLYCVIQFVLYDSICIVWFSIYIIWRSFVYCIIFCLYCIVGIVCYGLMCLINIPLLDLVYPWCALEGLHKVIAWSKPVSLRSCMCVDWKIPWAMKKQSAYDLWNMCLLDWYKEAGWATIQLLIYLKF